MPFLRRLSLLLLYNIGSPQSSQIFGLLLLSNIGNPENNTHVKVAASCLSFSTLL